METGMTKCIKDLIQNLNLVIGCPIGCGYCYARNNCRRFHMTDDFAVPVFYPEKLKMLKRKKPAIRLLTGMSDLSAWKPEWIRDTFEVLKSNPGQIGLFLTKQPELLEIGNAPENAWFGATVTRRSELDRLKDLRTHADAAHYHATFEPLFDDPGDADLAGIEWIVIGTMTGPLKKKIQKNPKWVYSLTEQAHRNGIPVFMKEDLVPIIGEENMIQELPEAFGAVLEEQKKWNRLKSK